MKSRTLFIPENKSKKTVIRGFWYSKETKKVYYDYLTASKISVSNGLFFKILDVKKQVLSQEAMFYKVNDCAFIYYSEKKIESLPNRKAFTIEKNFKAILKASKEALRAFGAFTVYIKQDCYIIEVFTN